MAKTKRVEREKKTPPSQEKETRAQAESKETNPLFEPAFSESTPPQSRPLNEEEPQSRAQEEDTARPSAASEEAELDTSVSAQGKERASSSMNVYVKGQRDHDCPDSFRKSSQPSERAARDGGHRQARS